MLNACPTFIAPPLSSPSTAASCSAVLRGFVARRRGFSARAPADNGTDANFAARRNGEPDTD